MTIDNAPGLGFRIEHIWAFVSQGEGDEDEGVCGVQLGGTFYPMIAADEDRVEQFRAHAERIARETGRTIKLVRFDERVELETIARG
jgi:hypothetical protein